MNGMHKVFGLLLAVVLTAVALPAAAQSKIYSLNISGTTSPTTTPPSIPTGVASTLYAIVKNETPNGNSSFNALALTAPAGLKINVAGTSTPNGQLSVAANGQSLTISNMSPVKNLQSVTITLSVTASVTSCTTTTLAWSVVPWTGSQAGSGQAFNLTPAPTLPYQPNTNVASAGCTYSVTADLGTVPAGSPSTTLNMTLKNTATGTVPAITSLASLNVPGALMVTGVSGAGVSNAGNVVSISGLSLSAGQSFAFTITVKTTPSCTGSGPFAWTSSVTPTGFSGSNPSTTIGGQSCSLSISGPPNVGAGGSFPVTVTLNGGPGGGNLNVTSNCSLSAGGGSIPVSGNSANFNITIAQTNPPTPQNCTINVMSDQPGYGSTSLTYNNVFAGVLGCDNASNFDSSNGNSVPSALDPNQDIAFVGQSAWGLRRGPNSMGPPPDCVKVNYTFTLGPGNTSNLVYDKGSPPQSATFKYVVIWNPVDVDQIPDASSGWTIFRPRVSWGIANPDPTPGSTDYVPALACVMDEPDLTALTAAELQALLPVIPGVPPFLGNPNTQYQPGIDPLTNAPRTAKMCVAQQGVTAVGQDPNYPNDPTKILIQFWDKVIDESDGHVQGP